MSGYKINGKLIQGLEAEMVPGIFIAAQLDSQLHNLKLEDPGGMFLKLT